MLKKIFTYILLLILSLQLGFNNTYTAYAATNNSNSAVNTTNNSQVDSNFVVAQAVPATKAPTKTTTKATATPKTVVDTTSPATLEALAKYIISEGIALVDVNTGRVLYVQNGDKIMYPASTTKIMTALLTIENVNLDDVVTVGTEATSVPADSSLISPRLSVGEKLTVRDLLYAMLYNSSNDAAETLALYVGGTRDNFIAMMNAEAKELGMDNTNYVNPHGYQDENHYTTPLDMARLAAYATKNETFMSIVSGTSYTIAKTNKNKARTLTNVNKLLITTSSEYLKEATGMKTGTTSDAQECFVSSAASSDGKSIVCVTLKHPIDYTSNRFVESKKLLQYGLNTVNTPVSAEAEYIYPSPTPSLSLVLSPTVSPTNLTLLARLGDFYTSLNIFLKIIVTILLIFILLIIILIILRKRKLRRRKYRSKYISYRARK